MLFGVELDAVREENLSYKNQISEHAVEDGAAVADHIQRMPRIVAITATIAGPDWVQRYDRLRELADAQEVGEYVGTTVWENVGIELFDPSHTVQVSNGVRFSMTLKQVRVARVETREFVRPDPVTAVEVETDTVERGRQQPGAANVDEDAEVAGRPSWASRLLFGEAA